MGRRRSDAEVVGDADSRPYECVQGLTYDPRELRHCDTNRDLAPSKKEKPCAATGFKPRPVADERTVRNRAFGGAAFYSGVAAVHFSTA
jgi:hypothetical protein